MPTANDNTPSSPSTAEGGPVEPGATGRGSRSIPRSVVDQLDEKLPVRHEELLIAAPLIEAVIEKLKAGAANDNEGST